VGRLIGIDLGTACTVMAVATPTGGVSVISNAAGRRKTQSVVAFTGTVPAVGDQRGHRRPSCMVHCVKAMLGDPYRRFRLPRSSCARPEEVAAILLARMKPDAERVLGATVTDVVLTVPASFDVRARRAMQDAGHIAGFRVRHVLNEPTAAALAYRPHLPVGSSALVFALGGGAFDVSLMRVAADGLEVRATAGDRQLGGWDWDNVLMRLVQDRLTALGGPDLLATDQGEAHLRVRSRAAKHRLSSALRTDVVLRHGAGMWQIPVTRVEFEAATAGLLARTRALVERLLAGIRSPVTGIDRVLLVGGPTRMPAVGRMLRLLLGLPLDHTIDPEEVVALGAALHQRAVRIREVASHGLGVLARDPQTGALRNVTVVPAGAALPAMERAVLTTGEDGQERVVVDVTQGDGAEPAAVRTVHREVLTLPARHPAGARIEIRCGYDDGQVPRIDVRELTTDTHLGRFVVRSAGSMSKADVRAASRRVAGLRWQ
jgi:molecular chaperone DnaK